MENNPLPSFAALTATNGTQRDVSRTHQHLRAMAKKQRSTLCAAYLSPDGCAFGLLCPARHVTGAATSAYAATTTTTTTTSGDVEGGEDMDGVPTTSSTSTFARPLCADGRVQHLWLWRSNATPMGHPYEHDDSVGGRVVGWRLFGPSWRHMLERLFLQLEGSGGDRILPDNPSFVVNFDTMTLAERGTHGHRRPIQRVEARGTPMWLVQPQDRLDAESPLVPVDAVAAQFLEYHFAQGFTNTFAMELGGVPMRINLLTMTGKRIPDGKQSAAVRLAQSVVSRAARGSSGARGATSPPQRASVSPPSSRPGGVPSPTTSAGTAAGERYMDSLAVLAKPREAFLRAMAKSRVFRLHRQPITLEMASAPSQVWEDPRLLQRCHLQDKTSKLPLLVLDNGIVSATDTAFASDATAELDTESILVGSHPLATCEREAASSGGSHHDRRHHHSQFCRWVSGHHAWNARHRCPASSSVYCPLRRLVETALQSVKEGGPIASKKHPWFLRFAVQRWELHRQLYYHDDKDKDGEESAQLLERLRGTAWKGASSTAMLCTGWGGGHVTMSFARFGVGHMSMNSAFVFPRTDVTFPMVGGTNVVREDAETATAWDHQERDANQTTNSETAPPAGAHAVTAARASSHSHPLSEYDFVHQQLLADVADVPYVGGVQRVHHEVYLQRYLMVRDCLVGEWMATERAMAMQSSERILYRKVPRSQLYQLLHDSDSDTANTGRFYFSASVALAEPSPPGAPMILLIAVGYGGKSASMSRVDAYALDTPPLSSQLTRDTVRGIGNIGAECSAPRQYLTHHSMLIAKGWGGGGAINHHNHAAHLNNSPALDLSELSAQSDETLTIASVSEGGATTTELSDAGDTSCLLLTDATQWCPLYLVTLDQEIALR